MSKIYQNKEYKMKNTTIIIPIFNEEDNIGLLIDQILLNFPGVKILVIDDCSTDKSAEIVKSKKNVDLIIKNKIDKGLTYSIIKGIQNTKTLNFIVMDGDFQHPVEYIKNFLELFEKNKDIVIGERKNINFKVLKNRFIISKIGNLLIKKIFGLCVNDPLSGFFGGKSLLFKKTIDINFDKFCLGGYKFLFEFLKIVKKENYNIGTFLFEFKKRKYGESKITIFVFFDFIKSIFTK